MPSGSIKWSTSGGNDLDEGTGPLGLSSGRRLRRADLPLHLPGRFSSSGRITSAKRTGTRRAISGTTGGLQRLSRAESAPSRPMLSSIPSGSASPFILSALCKESSISFSASFFGDVAAANLVVLWTFPASALAAYLLARTAGAGRAGSFLAGMVFAFCPYRLARLAGHYDLLGTEWIPLYAIALWKVFERDRLSFPWILAAGAFAAAAGYTASTYLVFLACFTLPLRGVPREPRAASSRHRGRRRDPASPPASARPTSIARASRTNAIRGPIATSRTSSDTSLRRLGRVFWEPSRDMRSTGTSPRPPFSRGTSSRPRRSPPSFSAARSRGPPSGSLPPSCSSCSVSGARFAWAGSTRAFPFPSLSSRRFPFSTSSARPSRFSIVAVLSLAVLLALVWSRAMNRFGRPVPLTFLASAFLAFEYLALPTPLFPAGVPPLYRELAKEADGDRRRDPRNRAGASRDDVPPDVPSEAHLHWNRGARPSRKERLLPRPSPGSPSHRSPQGKVEPSSELDELIESDREAAPRVARFLGLGYFVIDRGYEKRGVVSYLEALLPVDRWYENESVIVLSTRRSELPPDPDVLEAGARESRQHFESGFRRPEREGNVSVRWVNGERSTILFRRPAGVRHAIVEVAPREGLAIELDASLDGRELGARTLAAGMAGDSVPAFDAGRRARRRAAHAPLVVVFGRASRARPGVAAGVSFLANMMAS